MPRDILASAGIISVLLILITAIYLIIRSFRNAKSRKVKLSQEVESHHEKVDVYAQPRKKYDEMYERRKVPHNVMPVRMFSNNYSPCGSAVMHYCWISDGMLMFFPIWDSIISSCAADKLQELSPKDWCIPVSDILCFANEQGLPNRFVVLQYKRDSEILTLAFTEEAGRVFTAIIPDKDFSHLVKELYPKSSRNIKDIREGFASLKILREENLITEDEYVAKKKEMLISM